VLRPPAGDIPTRREGKLTWIRARPGDGPRFAFVRLDSAAAVDELERSPDGGPRTVAWAWLDEQRGTVRARAFLPEFGIPEDEATGAAALRLCAQLGRAVEIHQGAGSVLYAEPGEDGTVSLGGRVEAVERRAYAAPT
jgi:predicted PhzF superfamily epimerase YddE/YHI9